MTKTPQASTLAAAVFLTAAHVTALPERFPLDQREVDGLKSGNGEAFRTFSEGEAALFSGKPEAATSLFQKALVISPTSFLAERRLCQSLTDLGRKEEALLACRRAVDDGMSPMDLRAAVGAFTAGEEKPRVDQLGTAESYIARMLSIMPSQPWAYGALCDIGWRLGDSDMLELCLDKLERVAPDHFETARARSMVARLRAAAVPELLAWLGLGMACVATLVHAVLKRRARPSGAATVASLLLGLGITLASTAVRAQAAEGTGEQPGHAGAHDHRWKVDVANPEGSVPDTKAANDDPLQMAYFMMELSAKAEAALKSGDREAAIKYFRALSKAVPENSLPHSRLCELYDAAGNRQEALVNCRKAMGLKGTQIADYARFVDVLLAPQVSVLVKQDIEDVDAIVQHLKGNGATQEVAYHIECQLGARLKDVVRLTECVGALTKMAPSHPDTLSFQWALAVAAKQYVRAEALVEQAKKAGIAPEDVRQMQEATLSAEPTWRRLVSNWRVSGSALLVAASGIALLMLRRRRTSATA